MKACSTFLLCREEFSSDFEFALLDFLKARQISWVAEKTGRPALANRSSVSVAAALLGGPQTQQSLLLSQQRWS